MATPCNLRYLLTEAPIPSGSVIELQRDAVSGVFDMKGEMLMMGQHAGDVNVTGVQGTELHNLNVQDTEASTLHFTLQHMTLVGTMQFKAFSRLTLSEVHSNNLASLSISISQCHDVTLTSVTRDALIQNDFLKVEFADITGSIVVSKMQVENKEFETPLVIAGTKALQSIQLESCSFTNNQNGAVQIGASVRVKELLVSNCVFDGNQGAGANAMFAVVDGAVVEKIQLTGTTVRGNTGYFNGGGFAVDYSNVMAHSNAEATQLSVRIENCIFSKNLAGQQQKGGSLYVIAPASTEAYELSVEVIGGTIEESNAEQGKGGGIYMEGAQLSLSNGVTVQQNMAGQGAGIHIGKGVLHTDNTVYIRNNVADVFVGGVLFSTQDQVQASQIASMDMIQFNQVKVGTWMQANPNIGVLEPQTLRFDSSLPLSLKPYYPFAAGSGKEDPVAVAGYFVDSFGNAITLQSTVQSDPDAVEAVKKLYASIQLVETDPEHLQFHETPELTVEQTGFRVEPLEIVGEIDASTSMGFDSPYIQGGRYELPIRVASCNEGHLPTSVGDDATNPAQKHLKYCAFGDHPDLDTDNSNSDPNHHLQTVWRILAVTVILLIALLSFVILLLVGVIIRKNAPPVVDINAPDSTATIVHSDDGVYSDDDDDLLHAAHDDDVSL